MKKVSILIPVYNEEKMLPLLEPEVKKLIDSQKNKYEWEVVVVTAGSKDNSRVILKDTCT